MSWTQPMCDACWISERGRSAEPMRMTAPEIEQCAWCGRSTTSGIYVRADPTTVPHPAAD